MVKTNVAAAGRRGGPQGAGRAGGTGRPPGGRPEGGADPRTGRAGPQVAGPGGRQADRAAAALRAATSTGSQTGENGGA